MRYLKQATVAVEADDEQITATVKAMLGDIGQHGFDGGRGHGRARAGLRLAAAQVLPRCELGL